jgi:hypothetical protein
VWRAFSFHLSRSFYREAPVVVEQVMEDEANACTFDDDADPSIERCWADDATAGMRNDSFVNPELPSLADGAWGKEPMLLGAAGVTIVALIAVLGRLVQRKVMARKQQGGVPAVTSKEVTTLDDADPASQKAAPANSLSQDLVPSADAVEARVRELKISLEREAKEKQGLSEQNNFLKSALEERKATVQMFTSELQVRSTLRYMIQMNGHVLSSSLSWTNSSPCFSRIFKRAEMSS